VKVYADTGFLCSLYAPDAHTVRAVGRMKTQELPLPIVWLHDIEFRNALRLRVFRREITQAERDASLNAMLADIADGVLVHRAPSLQDILKEAERLSAVYSERLGTRTLAVLHVAAALVLGCAAVLTFDRRQRALASAAGLRTPEI
jgi:predicted nucleic acid-binding protein